MRQVCGMAVETLRSPGGVPRGAGGAVASSTERGVSAVCADPAWAGGVLVVVVAAGGAGLTGEGPRGRKSPRGAAGAVNAADTRAH